MAVWIRNRAYQAGTGVALLTALLTVWTTIVRDDGSGAGSFMVILAAGVGGFAGRFHAMGMARAMAGVAVMQVCLGALAATAPVTVNVQGGPLKVLLFNGSFAVLWLTSGGLFAVARKVENGADTGLI